jgi:hypothetical protein
MLYQAAKGGGQVAKNSTKLIMISLTYPVSVQNEIKSYNLRVKNGFVCNLGKSFILAEDNVVVVF